MNITKAERHNRMLNKTFDNYRANQEKLPPIELYSRFLDIAVEKLSITKDEARSKYGQFTIKEWEQLLKLGWNKS